MKYSDLIKYKGGFLELSGKAFAAKRVGDGPGQIASFGASAEDSKAGKVLGASVLRVAESASGGGMWVAYLAGRTVYGYLAGGQAWAASGPFSGCYFEVGRNDGQIYAAHISCEGKTDPNVAAWAGVLPGRTVLFSAKIGMSANLPAGTRNAAAIVFAAIAGGAVEVTRVDVQTASAGGMSGPIFDVQPVANAL